MDPTNLVMSLIFGGCIAGIAFANYENYFLMLDYIERDLKVRLRRLRIQTPDLRTLISSWFAVVGAFFLILGFGFDAFLFSFLMALLLCSAPWYLIRRLDAKRRQMIEDQLADAMVMFASGVRAGLSLAQALELLAEECPKPINQEFGQLIGEYKMGKPFERTLQEAKDRLHSENFVLFSAALLASRESGGRLNETVDRISKSVLELQRLERKVQSETAQARKSAVYMSIVPVFILLIYAWLDPTNVRLLFTTIPGQIMLSVSVVLNVLAYVWSAKILSPDI